jgi:hypothetical protein
MNRRTFIKLTGIATVAGLTTVPTLSAPKRQWTRAMDELPKAGKRIAFVDRPHPAHTGMGDTDYCISVGHMTNWWGKTATNFPLHHEFFARSNKEVVMITENMMEDYHNKDWQRFKKIREQAATLTVGGKRLLANRKMTSIRFKDNENASHISICTLHENMWWTYIDDNKTINLPSVPKPVHKRKRK